MGSHCLQQTGHSLPVLYSSAQCQPGKFDFLSSSSSDQSPELVPRDKRGQLSSHRGIMSSFPSDLRASFTTLYSAGNILQLRSHNPCQPFGEEWYKPPFDTASMERNATKSRLPSELTLQDFVFTKQSRDRDPSSPIPPFAQVYFDTGSHGHEIVLRVLENKPTGRATGSQVVLCEVQTSPSEYWRAMGWEESRFPSQVIAKIFDPLLYSTILSHMESAGTLYPGPTNNTHTKPLRISRSMDIERSTQLSTMSRQISTDPSR